MPDKLDAPARLRDAYQAVQRKIADAAARSGRKPQDVHLVAVTKYASLDQLRAIVELGQADLGENRVQQLAQRAPQLDEFLARRRSMAAADSRGPAELPEQIRWHMIGHLQRNKVKQVLPLVSMIHSVDSLRLAEELHALALRRDERVDVLVQVNTANEPQKAGVALPAAPHLCETIDGMVHLRLRGLMCMAPYGDDPEQARPVFARTADLFRDIRKAGFTDDDFNILSMGMTGDYEVAIEEGANVVRVGRALFGDEEG